MRINRKWLARYLLAVTGPIGTAVAQFIFSLQLLHTLNADAFGGFSFLLVASQLGLGIWGALFCAPFAVLSAARVRGEIDDETLASVYATNLILALLAIPTFVLLSFSLGVPLSASVVFGVYVCVSLLRWLGRAVAYAEGSPLKSTASDVALSAVLFFGIFAFWLTGGVTLEWVFVCQLSGVTLGLLPFGWRYLRRQFIDVSYKAIPRYRSIWVQHASWSLSGVVTTEATANAHAYIVTMLAGPAAFAPLAATTLIIRPISVVSNALAEFERSRMAIELGKHQWENADRGRFGLRILLILAWLGCTGATLALFIYDPFILFPRTFALSDLKLGATIWLIIALLRLMRVGESALLQAAGKFRSLAYASFVSCGISIIFATLLLFAGGPLVSLLGVLLGETFFAVGIWVQVMRLRRSATIEYTPDVSPSNTRQEAAS